jgi:hypothetical protein
MERIRATVVELDGSGAILGVRLTDRLQERSPAALRLLATDPATAGAAVIEELRRFASLVHDFPALESWARQLGAATGTAVSATEMEGIGAALIDAVGDVLGDGFLPGSREAWHSAVVLVVELIR